MYFTEKSQLLPSSLFEKLGFNLVSALEKSTTETSVRAKMNSTILDKILIENNLYQKNGSVFSSTEPKQFLGNLHDLLPKLLRNKSQLAKSESESF